MNTGMNTNLDLRALRQRFDHEVVRRKMSPETVKRYQSWIRRFIVFTRGHGVTISEKVAVTFLLSYSSRHSRRQGYFALKFLFAGLLEQRFEPEALEEYYSKKRYRADRAIRRKWFWRKSH